MPQLMPQIWGIKFSASAAAIHFPFRSKISLSRRGGEVRGSEGVAIAAAAAAALDFLDVFLNA